MCIPRPRSLLLAWSAVAASALGIQPVAAQGISIPVPPAVPATGNFSSPVYNPYAVYTGTFEGFRSPAVGFRAHPGMPTVPSSGAGSGDDASGVGSYGGEMSSSWYGAQGGQYGAASSMNRGAGGAYATMSTDAKSLSRVLTAAGVPNQVGRLNWPLGLRVVGGPAGDELRQQVSALFQYAAEQTRSGPVSTHLTQELARSVDALRRLLRRHREERYSLARTTYEDAERFLAKLDHARKLFEADPEPPAGIVR
jgi:hypothetical protein